MDICQGLAWHHLDSVQFWSLFWLFLCQVPLESILMSQIAYGISEWRLNLIWVGLKKFWKQELPLVWICGSTYYSHCIFSKNYQIWMLLNILKSWKTGELEYRILLKVSELTKGINLRIKKRAFVTTIRSLEFYSFSLHSSTINWFTSYICFAFNS